MELLLEPAAWASFATLAIMEIVLGVDNLVFISILAQRLPEEQQSLARKAGLGAALVTRLVLLACIGWVVTWKEPLFTLLGHGFSPKDLILLFGGLFLLYKGTTEIHGTIEGVHEMRDKASAATASFGAVIAQIALMDVIFSLDSVITAVGMAQHLSIMVAAIVVSMVVMVLAVNKISAFIHENPTVKMLALSFLMLIGTVLVAEGMGAHVSKGYIYFAIFFSLFVEWLNMMARKKKAAGGKGFQLAIDSDDAGAA
jgi:predicted tellurium resistance membrane protein TerC